MKWISKFIFSVMSYMVGHFNNSRASKNRFLESSYKAVNWILDWAQSTMTARNNLYRRAVLVKVQYGFQRVFLQNHARLIKYCFLVMFYIHEDSNNSRKWKNAILERSYKTANWIMCLEILREEAWGRFRKVLSGFQTFPRKCWKETQILSYG